MVARQLREEKKDKRDIQTMVRLLLSLQLLEHFGEGEHLLLLQLLGWQVGMCGPRLEEGRLVLALRQMRSRDRKFREDGMYAVQSE